MTICGIELSASEARLVLLEGKKDDFIVVDAKPRKTKLNNEADQKEVKAFRDSILAFLKEYQVSIVTIKKRGEKGAFSGGSVGFKLEGILQLYDECPVILVPLASSARLAFIGLSYICVVKFIDTLWRGIFVNPAISFVVV